MATRGVKVRKKPRPKVPKRCPRTGDLIPRAGVIQLPRGPSPQQIGGPLKPPALLAASAATPPAFVAIAGSRELPLAAEVLSAAEEAKRLITAGDEGQEEGDSAGALARASSSSSSKGREERERRAEQAILALRAAADRAQHPEEEIEVETEEELALLTMDLTPLAALAADEASRGGLTAEDLADTLYAAAALTGPEGQALQAQLPLLSDTLLGRAGDLSARGASDALWAAATLRNEAAVMHSILPALVERLIRGAGGLTPQAAASALWSIGELRHELKQSKLRLEPIVRFLVRFVFPPGKGTRPGDAGGDAGGEMDKAKRSGLGAKALAGVLWALAAVAPSLERSMLQALAPLLSAELAACVESGELQEEPQAVSTMLWAVTSIQKASANLTDALLPHLFEALPAAFDRMTPRQVAIVIWALGALEALADTERRAREKEEEEIRKRRPRLASGRTDKAAEAAAATAAAAKEEAEEEDSDILEIKAWARKLLTEHRTTALRALSSTVITLDDIALATWGFASLGHRDEAVMKAAVDRAESWVTRCGHKPLAKNLPRILWACAKLDCFFYVFMNTVADVFEPARQGMRHLAPDAFHAMIWSFEKLDKSNTHAYFRKAMEMAVWKMIKENRRIRAKHIDLGPDEDLSLKLRTHPAMSHVHYMRHQLMYEKAVKLGELGPDADMTIQRTHQEKENTRREQQVKALYNRKKGYTAPLPKLSWFLRQSIGPT